ncbi:nSTAND1 domain-containing NTPase [Sorangium sp. So ce1389]|uniref:nSTAND1 domain-containing NTPase n=1 Tax=Sorangium sp. So ce1389 TaxID=3133336 RepID=UPI003F622D87
MARDPGLEDLEAAYRDGNVVVFAGPGVSTAAGLPSRAELVERLLERARARGVDEERRREIEALAGRRRLIDALSAAKEAVGTTEFCGVVERHLDDWERDLPEVADAIARLEPRAVLTTNLDLLLERAFQGRWPALARATGNIAQRRRFILKIFGTLMDRSTWVMTREEHERAAHRDPHLTSVFQGLFRTCPMLFVGCDPGDDDFEAVLAWVRDAAGEQPPTHWALFAEDTVTRWVRTELERLGLRPIQIDGRGDARAEVARILRDLAASKQAHATRAPVRSERPAMQRAGASRGAAAPAPAMPLGAMDFMHSDTNEAASARPAPAHKAIRPRGTPRSSVAEAEETSLEAFLGPADLEISDASGAIGQAMLRLEPLIEPIDGGVGIDITYDESFEALRNEIDKLQSLAGGKVDWERVASGAEEILAKRSKDFRVALYYAAARTQLDKLRGLLDGLVLVQALSNAFWDTMYPAINRPKARGNVCAWFGDLAAATLAGLIPSAAELRVVNALDRVSGVLDADLSDRLGDAYAGLGPLRSAIRSHVATFPAEAPPPPPPPPKAASAAPVAVAMPPVVGAGPDGDAPSSCPFRGREPYGEADAALFVGREAEINEALQRLGDTDAGRRRWLLIDGERGAGKSSLVRAGLVPRVRAGGWIHGAPEPFRAAVLGPTPDPIRGLAAALWAELHARVSWTAAKSLAVELDAHDAELAKLLRAQVGAYGEGFLLVLDPLEPVLEAPPRARAQLEGLLVKALRDPDGPLYLVTTLSTGSLPDLGAMPVLRALLETHGSRYTLGPMSAPGLRAALGDLVKAAGLRWEPGLLERIVEDAQRAAAPVEQVTALLRALWEASEGDLLTGAVYEALGGVAGAAVHT